MRAINLKTNHLTAPVGIDAGPLFLSWQCADGVRQTAYEIQLTANGEMLWHSGKTEGTAMHADVPAVSGSRVSGCWRVRLWDETDVPGAWSEARFETGLAQCDWIGEWVDPETEPIDIPGDDAINAFARPNWERKQAEKEIKLLQLSEELGKDVIFKIRSLPYNTVARLREKEDQKEFSLHVVLEGVVSPNLRDEELLKAHDAPTPIELIKSILRPGEIEDISIQIEKLSGYRTDTVRLVEDIKKK